MLIFIYLFLCCLDKHILYNSHCSIGEQRAVNNGTDRFTVLLAGSRTAQNCIVDREMAVVAV